MSAPAAKPPAIDAQALRTLATCLTRSYAPSKPSSIARAAISEPAAKASTPASTFFGKWNHKAPRRAQPDRTRCGEAQYRNGHDVGGSEAIGRYKDLRQTSQRA